MMLRLLRKVVVCALAVLLPLQTASGRNRNGGIAAPPSPPSSSVRFTTARSYRLVGDARPAIGITTTAGSAAFGGLRLTARDVGKVVIVPGAGANGNPLYTRVATPTTFAAPARETTTDATLFAPLGMNCPVATPQNGAGSYAAGDAIRLADGGAAHVVCEVQYTRIVSAAIVSGGQGCINGTFLVHNTTGRSSSGSRASIKVTVADHTIVAVDGIPWGGRFQINPTDLDNEPVSGVHCAGAVLSLKMGVVIARVATAGLLPGAAPADPIPQAATSGRGTGAAFDMGAVWKSRSRGTAANHYLYSAWYGTDNSPAMAALAAAATPREVRLGSGTYLLNCGQYAFRSATSLFGAGPNVTTLKLFPFCWLNNTPLLRWTLEDAVSVADLTIDDSLAWNAAGNRQPNGASLINNRGGDDFRVENLNIINLANRVGGINEQSFPRHAMHNPYFNNLFIAFVSPDTTADGAVTIGDAGRTGVFGARGSHLRSIGGENGFCTNGGFFNDFDISGLAYAAGIWTQFGDPNCHDESFANIRVHDSLQTLDVDGDSNGGIEADGPATHVNGLWAWNLGGDGARCASLNSTWDNVAVWDNGATPIPGSPSAGFHAISVRAGQICRGARISGLRAYDSGRGVQKYGYAETAGGGGPFTGITVQGAISGPRGAYRLSRGSDTRVSLTGRGVARQ